jgi:hypothetical protein
MEPEEMAVLWQRRSKNVPEATNINATTQMFSVWSVLY